MRFKVDENLPENVATLLRSAGHDAVTVFDERLSGQPDTTISTIILREERALITFDLDFSDIRTYPPSEYPGLVVLRLECQDKPSTLRALGRILPLLEREPLDGYLWIVTEASVRMRGGESMEAREAEVQT